MRRGRLLSHPKRGGMSERHAPISKASVVQREKVAEIGQCAVTGCRGGHPTFSPLDPAHLWPRSMGGGDDALDVVPLCRAHHREFDHHELDLLPHLIRHYSDEVAFAVKRANGDLVAVLERLTGGKVTIEDAGESV